jgi:hypothetical protein
MSHRDVNPRRSRRIACVCSRTEPIYYTIQQQRMQLWHNIHVWRLRARKWRRNTRDAIGDPLTCIVETCMSRIMHVITNKSNAIPVKCNGGQQGCWMLRITHCLGNRLIISCQHYAPAALYSPETFFLYLVLMSVRDRLNPKASGLEPATFRPGALCLNQLRHRLPQHAWDR